MNEGGEGEEEKRERRRRRGRRLITHMSRRAGTMCKFSAWVLALPPLCCWWKSAAAHVVRIDSGRILVTIIIIIVVVVVSAFLARHGKPSRGCGEAEGVLRASETEAGTKQCARRSCRRYYYLPSLASDKTKHHHQHHHLYGSGALLDIQTSPFYFTI